MREKRRNAAAPEAGSLQEAALAHLARYAATEAGLLRVLERRIDRWARTAAADPDADADSIAAQAATARIAAAQVVARLAGLGAVSDAAFAESRARRLVRSGRSRQAITAHLTARGIDPALARDVTPDDPATELAAALALARRRRIGPFRTGAEPDEAGRRRELAMLARAGFSHGIASRALAMDAQEAESLVIALRRG